MNKLQEKILEIMVFINKLCRENQIEYYIMGGTALGAVRHGGFIPWDDDLDIWMTYENYKKFKKLFYENNYDKFILQEWKIVDDYLQYAKVRMNGTTFVEKQFMNNKDLHQGIYVDIMILHKTPKNKKSILNRQYFASKYVTLKGNLATSWKPKSSFQKFLSFIAKILPKWFDKKVYKYIYKYDVLNDNFDYIYYITKGNKNTGYFDRNLIEPVQEIDFEGISLYCINDIKKYLEIRYGDYMKLPPLSEQKSIQHAEIWDVEKDYKEYIK